MTRLFALLHNTRFLRFLFAGGFATLVNLGSRVLLSRVVSYEVAILIAYGFGILTAWILMRLLVFAPSGRSMAAELLRFVLVNVVGLIQVEAISVALVRTVFPALGFTTFPELVAHFIGLMSLTLTSYFLHKKFTYVAVAKS